MRIAIIGGGGAGLVAAWLLESHHEITLYERADRMGGHADTLDIQIGDTLIAVYSGELDDLQAALAKAEKRNGSSLSSARFRRNRPTLPTGPRLKWMMQSWRASPPESTKP